MSLLARDRSTAYRLLVDREIRVQRFGPLHASTAMLEWGSITKTVTATAAARLQAAGVIDLGAPVTTHLPAAALPESVTLASLIAHTSGLPSVPAGMTDVLDPYARFTTAVFDDEVLPALATQWRPPRPLPGYSNLGYAVLTRALEVATGEPWWSLARRFALEPLGVADAAIDPPRHRRPVVRSWSGTPRAPWTMRTGPFVGAGGLWGTFAALEHYATAALADHGRDASAPGWQRTGALLWHNGHVRDSGAFVAVDTASGRVVTAHTLGRFVGTADRVAKRLLRRHG